MPDFESRRDGVGSLLPIGLAMLAPVVPPSPDALDIIRRVVDPAPPLPPTLVAEIAALFGGAR